MYSTCLHCTRDLGRNQMVETLPVGRRLAFDADKGRLWVVCPSCGKWNLVPFDTRLESIDACERLFRDTRTRYSTDNIGMARVGDGLTLVRVGKALRPEFASWRYGEQYKRRRRMAFAAGGVGAATALGVAAATGAALGFGIWVAGYGVWEIAVGGYKLALNRRVRLRATNPESGLPVTIGMWSFRKSALVWEGATPHLRVPRRAGQLTDPFRWEGEAIPSMGRRVTGGLNLTTGSAHDIAAAVAHLGEHNGDLSGWLASQQRRLEGGVPAVVSSPTFAANRDSYLREHEEQHRPKVLLSALPVSQRLAVEMWFSEDIERRWLEGELRWLEREWREAEKLAKIADDLVLDDGT